MAKDRLNSYKLSCVGVDETGNRARCTFFVYGVENVEAAREQVRADNQRRRIMRRQRVDWRTVTLRAVRCNMEGGVGATDRKLEEQIERQEQEQLDVLFAEYKVRTHWANVEKNA